MLQTSWLSFTLLAFLLLAGCRSPEGRIPTPTGDEPNEIEELSRDFLNVAGGDPQALKEMTDDLGSQGPLETGQPRAAALAKSFQAALVGRQLTAEQAKRLADEMYVTFSADQLSPGQLEALQARVAGVLREIGSPEPAIEQVTTEIAAVQRLVNPGRKRWWDIL